MNDDRLPSSRRAKACRLAWRDQVLAVFDTNPRTSHPASRARRKGINASEYQSLSRITLGLAAMTSAATVAALVVRLSTRICLVSILADEDSILLKRVREVAVLCFLLDYYLIVLWTVEAVMSRDILYALWKCYDWDNVTIVLSWRWRLAM
ncbi:uncharacterized protein BCR38DRAFT_448072 [Pseudomassariella vexata]|uniref:Uncharacterized protein n=1 Tax=Pseudomassariella vexata TaxID=1141098 RepID=A0A1Y2DFZ1_9PEZI|nr:uncharacterized protein BCR38DRAFT_448072 [Pseudomassariella vexata]ORY58117.1 hypothetical protein BCR38DRAFT_448072 [Pseudomassariella vexata]